MYTNEAIPATDALQFNVAQLLKEATGATRRYDVKADIQNELDESVIPISPLVGQVTFLRTGMNILMTGRLQTTLRKDCARCLTEFTAPVLIELEEEFYPSVDVVTGRPLDIPKDIEPANIIDEQNILNMVEVVRQELVVADDTVLACRPDCRGLCPHCGQDLNVSSCDCEDNQVDPRWADLKALQSDD